MAKYPDGVLGTRTNGGVLDNEPASVQVGPVLLCAHYSVTTEFGGAHRGSALSRAGAIITIVPVCSD